MSLLGCRFLVAMVNQNKFKEWPPFVWQVLIDSIKMWVYNSTQSTNHSHSTLMTKSSATCSTATNMTGASKTITKPAAVGKTELLKEIQEKFHLFLSSLQQAAGDEAAETTDLAPTDLPSDVVPGASENAETPTDAIPDAAGPSNLPPGHFQVLPSSAPTSMDRLHAEFNSARKELRKLRGSTSWCSDNDRLLSEPENHAVFVVWYLESLLQCLTWLLPRQPTEMSLELLKKLKKLKRSVLAIGSHCPPFELTRDHRNVWKNFSRKAGYRNGDRVIVTRDRMKTLDAHAVEMTVDYAAAVAKFIGANVPVSVLPDLGKVNSLVQQFRFHQKNKPIWVQHDLAGPLLSGGEDPQQVIGYFMEAFETGLSAFDVDRTANLDVAHKFVRVLIDQARGKLEKGIRSKKLSFVYEATRVFIVQSKYFKVTNRDLVEQLETVNSADVFTKLRVVFAVCHRLHTIIPTHNSQEISETLGSICGFMVYWPSPTAAKIASTQ